MNMLQKINWPTAAVLCVFIAAWTVLAVLHMPIPVWMIAAGAIAGKVLMSLMPSLVDGTSSTSSSTPGGSS